MRAAHAQLAADGRTAKTGRGAIHMTASASTMRACVYDAKSPSGVKLVELPRPKASSSCALVRVRAAGVNPVDAKYIIGDKLPESWMEWSARKVAGHTPGFDFSGTVEDVAAGASVSIGDDVFGFACNPAKLLVTRLHGSMAEYVLAPLNQLAKKPAALSHTEAAALPLVGTTAMQAFKQHRLRRGQRVLVIGASGGVGHVAVQVARHLGAHVTAVCSGRNAAFVQGSCGAHAVLAYDEGDIYEQLRAAAAAHGAWDLVLDCVSSADARDRAASYAARVRAMEPPVVRRGGAGVDAHNYVVLGGATGDWGLALVKRFVHLNLFSRGFELFWIKMPGASRTLRRLSEFADAPADAATAAPDEAAGAPAAAPAETPPRPLTPRVETRLPFSEEGARQAFDALRSRRTAGKIVLEMPPPPPG